MKPADVQEWVTHRQQRLPRVSHRDTKTLAHYRRSAAWWELEALREYDSAPKSREYAANMRWAAEIVRATGPGTWPDLAARQAEPRP